MSDTIHLPLSVATRLCAELDADENADTPETNAAERMAFSGEYMVPTKVARRLERQRDEAREERDRAQAWLEEIFRNLGLPFGDMGALENYILKRDELQKETPWGANNETKESWFECQREKFQYLEEELEKTRRERDELRVAYEIFSSKWQKTDEQLTAALSRMDLERLKAAQEAAK